MKSFYRFIGRLLFAVLISGVFSPVFSQEPDTLEKKSARFFNAPANEARAVLSGFSDAELTELIEEWKKTLSLKDQRKLWVVKEFQERRADAVAADRLFYVFLAVFLTVLLILIFVISIYKTYRRIEKELE